MDQFKQDARASMRRVRQLPRDVEFLSKGDWTATAYCARQVLMGRITLHRGTAKGDIRRLVSDDDYLEALQSVDKAREILVNCLERGATRLPADASLIDGTWPDGM